MWKLICVPLAALALSACVTVAKYTIKDDLMDIGIPERRAECMANQLDERLSDDDLKELASYTRSLERSDTPGQALDALLQIRNPRAVGAITASGISCAFAPRD